MLHTISVWLLAAGISARDFIIINSAHSGNRRNNDLMHEIAHIVLEHEPAQMVTSPKVVMFLDNYNERQEEEADWLAAALLAPRQAAVKSCVEE